MLQDSVVLITGASSGIGAACAQVFAEQGARLILAARRREKLAELAEALTVPTHLLKLDVRDRPAVAEALASLPPQWQAIDVLVNNAGLSRGLDKLQEADIQDWEEMIDTNIKGLLYMIRLILPGMLTRQKGQIINIGSIAGLAAYPGGNVYCATKAAVKLITEGLKQDLLGTPIRVTNVEPGLVETEFSIVRFHGDKTRAGKVYQGLTPLTPRDVAEVVVFCTTRPAHVNINEVVLMPVDQASATQVHRLQ